MSTLSNYNKKSDFVNQKLAKSDQIPVLKSFYCLGRQIQCFSQETLNRSVILFDRIKYCIQILFSYAEQNINAIHDPRINDRFCLHKADDVFHFSLQTGIGFHKILPDVFF